MLSGIISNRLRNRFRKQLSRLRRNRVKNSPPMWFVPPLMSRSSKLSKNWFRQSSSVRSRPRLPDSFRLHRNAADLSLLSLLSTACLRQHLHAVHILPVFFSRLAILLTSCRHEVSSTKSVNVPAVEPRAARCV